MIMREQGMCARHVNVGSQLQCIPSLLQWSFAGTKHKSSSYLTNREMTLQVVCATPSPAKCMEIIATTPASSKLRIPCSDAHVQLLMYSWE